jgi:hypothetical protein
MSPSTEEYSRLFGNIEKEEHVNGACGICACGPCRCTKCNSCTCLRPTPDMDEIDW